MGSRQLANLITLPTLRFTGFGSKQLRNFAYAGATSGNAGSSRSGLERFPIGLRAQTRAFAANTSSSKDLDALLMAGSNDITDLVANPDPLKAFLATPGRRDDRQFEKQAARRIVVPCPRGMATIKADGAEEEEDAPPNRKKFGTLWSYAQ